MARLHVFIRAGRRVVVQPIAATLAGATPETVWETPLPSDAVVTVSGAVSVYRRGEKDFVFILQGFTQARCSAQTGVSIEPMASIDYTDGAFGLALEVVGSPGAYALRVSAKGEQDAYVRGQLTVKVQPMPPGWG